MPDSSTSLRQQAARSAAERTGPRAAPLERTANAAAQNAPKITVEKNARRDRSVTHHAVALLLMER